VSLSIEQARKLLAKGERGDTRALAEVIRQLLEGGSLTIPAEVFPGVIWDFGGPESEIPSGWLACYGQAVSRTTYADLFDTIGTTWGAGDGSTTFNVPDLRGRVTAGQDDMGGVSANRLTGTLTGGINGDNLGATGGEEGHQLTTAELPAHNHPVPPAVTVQSGSGSTAMDNVGSTSTTGDTGGGASHNNVQPTAIVNKIIKT